MSKPKVQPTTPAYQPPVQPRVNNVSPGRGNSRRGPSYAQQAATVNTGTYSTDEPSFDTMSVDTSWGSPTSGSVTLGPAVPQTSSSQNTAANVDERRRN